MLRSAIHATGLTHRFLAQLNAARASATHPRRTFAERHARLDRRFELAQIQREQAENEAIRDGRHPAVAHPKTGDHPNFNVLVPGLSHDRQIPIRELTPRRRHQLALRLNQVIHNLGIQRAHCHSSQVSLQSALEVYRGALGRGEFASDRTGHEGSNYWL